MNIYQETLPVKPKWRAKEGEQFAYITINSFGQVHITKAYDNRKQAENRLYESGDYFQMSEVHRFAEILKTIIKNRL